MYCPNPTSLVNVMWPTVCETKAVDICKTFNTYYYVLRMWLILHCEPYCCRSIKIYVLKVHIFLSCCLLRDIKRYQIWLRWLLLLEFFLNTYWEVSRNLSLICCGCIRQRLRDSFWLIFWQFWQYFILLFMPTIHPGIMTVCQCIGYQDQTSYSAVFQI